MSQSFQPGIRITLAVAFVVSLAACAAPAPRGDGHRSQSEPIARNTRTYCRDDIERTGTNDVASAVRQSASSARKC